MFAFLAIVLLAANAVRAGIYVTNPVQSSQCTGGQPCQVDFRDDGNAPLLSAIGECQVGLYTGQLQQVQSLPAVNVATTTSFSFTPDPAAGPNGQYYLVFTASSISYQAFSASFTLTGMSGTTPGGGSSVPASTPGTGTSSGSTGSTPVNTPSSTGSTPGTTPTTPTTSPLTTTSPTSTRTTPTTSASVSATPTGAASRVGSSTSLGGLAALFALSGILAF